MHNDCCVNSEIYNKLDMNVTLGERFGLGGERIVLGLIYVRRVKIMERERQTETKRQAHGRAAARGNMTSHYLRDM